MSVLMPAGGRDVFAELSRFRTAFHGCLSRRADAFFELADALLCADASCSPDRLFCLVHGRSSDHLVPGWPYSFVAALTPDRTSWTQVLDAVRLGPVDDAAAVTADQLRAVAERLIAAGQWQRDDRDILVVMDAGYDVMRLAWVLRDLPV